MQEAAGPEIAGMKAGGEQATHPVPQELLTYAILHVMADQEGMPRAQVIDHVQIPLNRDEDTGDVVYGTPASQSIYRHGDAMDAAQVPQDGVYISVALDSDTNLFAVETVRKVNRKYRDND